jgi:hypothetical protein
MAKHKYGRKKGKKSTSHRSKRSAAGKKAWRTKVRKYGRERAIAMSFGGKSRRGKRKRGYKRQGPAKHRSLRARRLAKNPALVLAAIQKKEGTTGQPATKGELRLARIIVSRAGRSPKFGPTGEEARRIAFEKKLKREKQEEAARRVAHKLRVRAAEEAEMARQKAQREAESEISAEYSRL